uniref:response regulator n=1 Tax=Acetatifactor sp. TaxID=1872090 RepID=UPI004055A68D
MFSQLFGKYLVEKAIISDDDYKAAIKQQLAVRVKLGTIAIADGLLTEDQVENINKLQMQYDKRFGDIAVEKGFLTSVQIDNLLKKQGNPYMQFVQVLLEAGKLSATVLDKTLSAFQKENGYSDSDMMALKNDNIDALVPIFAVSAKPHVTDIAGLVARNINRFITRDFYIGKMHHEKSFNYRYLAGQKAVGDDTVYLAFAESSDEGAFSLIASAFSGEAQSEVNGDTYDAVCEFVNVNNGLFASELSKKEINLDMEPVFAYQDQIINGDFYVLPIYIENREINLIIAVNSEVEMGKTPYTYESQSNAIYEAKADSNGTVVLVDDSKMSRNMLRAILEEAGYSVIGEAGNGADAINVFKQCKPDLITLDITMPEMDGIEALKELQKIDADVKAIMITAAGQQSKLIEALKCGAKRFITKPFEKDEILSNISDVMSE